MNKDSKHTSHYVNSIIEDVQSRFVSERTVEYSESRIKREYEFEDGAIVRYDWQSVPGRKADEKFNHRFTLTNLPKPNPAKLKTGVIREIDFAAGGR
ncbi:MAG: hypothetical protein KDB79_04805 [Acidobacteria bacterium]|nr:hypothetical protein [Acidobacteriota bacterium]